MTEKEKMLLGEIYNANYDEELIKERQIVKDLCYEYNKIKPSSMNLVIMYLLHQIVDFIQQDIQ